MQSKKSLFNSALFKKNLMRYWPMWGFGIFVALIIIMAFASEVLGAPVSQPYRAENFLLMLIDEPVTVVSLGYGMLCAWMLWQYLYNPRSVGMMHSLPIKRLGIFITNVVSGIVMMMIPYLVAAVVASIIMFASGAFAFKALFILLAAAFCESLFFFSLASFVAMLTGHLAVMPLLYLLINFIYVIYEALINWLTSALCFGIVPMYRGDFDFLSPAVRIMRKVDVYVKDASSSWSRSDVSGFETILYYGAFSLVILAVTWLIYKNRKSESSGEIIAVAVFKPVIFVMVEWMAVFCIATIVYTFAFESNTDYMTFGQAVFCILIGILVVFTLLKMLFAKTIRVFDKRYVMGFVLSAAFGILICATLRFDLFGRQRYVPDTKDIVSVSLNGRVSNNNSITFDMDKNPEMVKMVTGIHKAIVDRTDFYMASDYYSSDDLYSRERIRISYRMADGTVLSREYRILVTSEELSDPDSVGSKLTAYANMDETKLAKNGLYRLEGEKPYAILYRNYPNDDVHFDTRETRELLDNVCKDILEEGAKNFDFFDYSYNTYMSVKFIVNGDDEWGIGYVYVSVTVDEDMKNTIAYLLDKEAITEDELVIDEYIGYKYVDDAIYEW